MNGNICEIEKFALHDGPGIRTVIFFRGCPLNCIWCSNPETQNKEINIYYNSNKCLKCNRCITICKKNAILTLPNKTISINKSKCDNCLKCVDVCPGNALRETFQNKNSDDIIKEILKDKIFYQNSNGGVTLSGGEILSQPKFAIEILKKCKEHNIHTAIETSGFGETKDLLKICNYTDYIMFDIKHMDDVVHKNLTCVDNFLILKNLHFISKLKKYIVIRIPLINSLNDSTNNINKICKLANNLYINEIHLLPYHEYGKEKYKQLNKKYKLDESYKIENKNIKKFKKIIENHNIICIIGG